MANVKTNARGAISARPSLKRERGQRTEMPLRCPRLLYPQLIPCSALVVCAPSPGCPLAFAVLAFDSGFQGLGHGLPFLQLSDGSWVRHSL
jgi:hypothetical protein